MTQIFEIARENKNMPLEGSVFHVSNWILILIIAIESAEHG